MYSKMPPQNISKIIGEFLAGITGGFTIGFIPALLFYIYYPIDRSSDGEEIRLFMIVTMCLPIGYSLGSAVGVYLVGNIGSETGSLLVTLSGSLVAGLIVLGIIILLSIGLGFAIVGLISMASIFALVSVSIVMFNKTRRYKL